MANCYSGGINAGTGGHFMPEVDEQLAFLFEDDILAARFLVRVVYKKDFRDAEPTRT